MLPQSCSMHQACFECCELSEVKALSLITAFSHMLLVRKGLSHISSRCGNTAIDAGSFFHDTNGVTGLILVIIPSYIKFWATKLCFQCKASPPLTGSRLLLLLFLVGYGLSLLYHSGPLLFFFFLRKGFICFLHSHMLQTSEDPHWLSVMCYYNGSTGLGSALSSRAFSGRARLRLHFLWKLCTL